MAKNPPSARKVLLLPTGQAYRAPDFEDFEYVGTKLTGSKAILRLRLKKGTTIDLRCTNEQLHVLLKMLCDAFGPVAIAHLKKRKWIPSENAP